MAKLNRFAQKIFGSGAGPNQIGVFGSLFAGSAATTTDPKVAQSLSNWLTGWFGAAIGGNAPAIEDMNAPFFNITYQLAYMLQMGIAEWDSETTYYKGSFVNDALGNLYYSLIDDNLNNLLTDTSSWKIYSTDKTGVGKDFWGTSLPAGYIWASGKTIGSAASNATERANADTLDLYTMLWNGYSNSILPIYDSAGAPTIRGSSAAADFAANKQLSVIDKRGRVSAGKDDMGGTAANRLTATTVSPNGTTLGASGGEQTHTLITSEMPSHTHTQDPHNHTQNPHQHGVGSYAGTPAGTQLSGPGDRGGTTATTDATTATNNAATATNQNTGGDGAHNNVQPTIVCNYIIKL